MNPVARRALDRRQLLRLAAGVPLVGCARPPVPVAETPAADAPMRFPGKVPMRVINDRPPCLETPWDAFRTDLTPNDAFYVRSHLQVIPTAVDTRTWRLKVGGHVERPLELSLADLRRMDPASLVAVNQCSGNSRGLFEPNLSGAQWGNGAMGNARWTGVRLTDVLDRAGLRAGSIDVTFEGLDRGGLPSIPEFVKSLRVEDARRPEVLLAYAMNDEPLPLLNGFPLRLVVPGWYATYWIKSLSDIRVLPHAYEGYWVAKAYRIPTTPNALETPAELAKVTVPINRMNVRSFFTTPAPGAQVPAGRVCELDGVAFDGGSGVNRVEVSTDAGRTWQDATLGADLGRFSFRRWRLAWTPTAGDHQLLVRATSTAGETQPTTAGWNRGGYMRNVVEELRVTAG